jgi:hypothetical protein
MDRVQKLSNFKCYNPQAPLQSNGEGCIFGQKWTYKGVVSAICGSFLSQLFQSTASGSGSHQPSLFPVVIFQNINILSCVSVTKDGVWIGNWIY